MIIAMNTSNQLEKRTKLLTKEFPKLVGFQDKLPSINGSDIFGFDIVLLRANSELMLLRLMHEINAQSLP